MKAETRIREELKRLEIYPVGEVNACHIYKNWEGWHIQRFGEQPWRAGANLAAVLETLRSMAESRQ